MAFRLALVAYDIADPSRLKAARKAVTSWATGGQRSILECPVRAGDRVDLHHAMIARVVSEDRLTVLYPRRRRSAILLGRAVSVEDGPALYIG